MASIGEGSETFPSVSRSLSTKPFTYTRLQTLRVTRIRPHLGFQQLPITAEEPVGDGGAHGIRHMSVQGISTLGDNTTLEEFLTWTTLFQAT